VYFNEFDAYISTSVQRKLYVGLPFVINYLSWIWKSCGVGDKIIALACGDGDGLSCLPLPVFSNCLKSLRGKSRLRRSASMSFQAVGPEEPKKRGLMLVVQDRGTSSLFASAERNRGRPGTEVSSSATGNRVPDRADTCMSADIT